MKRIICLVLIVALAAVLCLPVMAADIWFIAVDDSIPVTLTGSGVPFYYNSQLYIPYTSFDSDTLNVFSIYDSSQNILAMYNIDHRLTFDIDAGTVTNLAGDSASVAALSRNGTYYVPVFYVASYFGLGCSLLEGSGGYPIVRLTSGSEIYDNDKFITQSKALVESRASQYLSENPVTTSSQPQQSPVPSAQPTVSPQQPEVTVEEPEDPITVPDVALFLPGTSFDTVCDSLGSVPAVFTYTVDSLEGSDDEVRAILCAGYSIAIELDMSDLGHALEAASRFNQLLDEMSCTKTMLILGKNPTDHSVDALEQYGYRVWQNTVNAVGDFNVTEYEGRVSVFMPEPKATGVSYLVKFVIGYGGSFVDVRPTTDPF